MQTIPLVSVIVPAFNAETFLPRTLSSLGEQTLRDFELVLVNDGSTDRTGHVAKQIASDFGMKHRIIEQKNFGPSVARNVGLENSSGRYIKFLDADDILTPNALEILVSKIEESRCNFVFGKQDLVKLSGAYVYRYEELYDVPPTTMTFREAIHGLLVGRFHASLNSSLFSRDLVEGNRIRFTPGAHYMEDFEFLAKAVYFSRNVGFVNHVAALATYRESSATKAASLKLFHNVATVRRLAAFFERLGESEIAETIRMKAVPWQYVWTLGGLAYNGFPFKDWMVLSRHPVVRSNLRLVMRSLRGESRLEKKITLAKVLYRVSPALVYWLMRLLRYVHDRNRR